jgi:hypothetical protein
MLESSRKMGIVQISNRHEKFRMDAFHRKHKIVVFFIII